MKLFCLLQKYFEMFGIYKTQVYEPSKRFNIRNSLPFIFLLLLSVLAGIYLIFEAKTLNEISNSINSFTSTLTIAGNFAVIIWQTPTIFSLIESFEELIQRRKHLKKKIEKNDEL